MVSGQGKGEEKGSKADLIHCQSSSGAVMRAVGCWVLPVIS